MARIGSIPVRIAVDAMGGDFAPAAAVEGAHRAAVEDGVAILLVGQEEKVRTELRALGASSPLLQVVHAAEVVGMDEPAVTPLRRKRRSSLMRCAELVRDGEAQGWVTAGNTGAAMAAAMKVMGTLPGIDRPALAAVLPSASGHTVLLDVGANVSTKPHQLRQFAVMGHLYAQASLGIAAPRVGLMSVGEEEGKGTELTREVFKALKQTGLNFVGNVEGRDVYAGTVDVVVCDGFVGNVLLKSSESLARMIADMLREELGRSGRTKLGAWMALPALRSLKEKTDPNEHGAAPLLGVAGGCFIGHGRSTARGIQSAVRRAVELARAGVYEKLRDQIALVHQEEERLLAERGAVEVSDGE